MKIKTPEFSRYQFHPVVQLGENYEVYDFSKEYDPKRQRHSLYGVGKYNEHRPQRTKTHFFKEFDSMMAESIWRLRVLSGTLFLRSVELFCSPTIPYLAFRANGRHAPCPLRRCSSFALFGHLSRASLEGKKIGDKFVTGEIIAYLATFTKTAGWNPHLHFHWSWRAPKVADMPVSSESC